MLKLATTTAFAMIVATGGWLASASAINAAEILSGCDLKSVEDFKSIDHNSDGIISTGEYKDCLVGFQESTRVEREKGAQIVEERQEAFGKYDENSDGQITMDEFKKNSARVE